MPPRRDAEAARAMAHVDPGSIACPVKAVRACLEASNVTAGPLFRPIAKGGRIGTGAWQRGMVRLLSPRSAGRNEAKRTYV
jgi:hypothetical protein